ncbi:unnamed protein product [Cuscuta campestris]|uniref:Retrotransposon gag domain-containing protein n=1 Tax=Cuscuta campestris TaxID=132261 RepID=A0A484MAZ9_9ASTE|nr:unnamed protein product [Cuscuta campestris]
MAGRRTRRNTATSAQSTVRSDHPEQGIIVPVNGLETALNNVANMMANIMEQLDKALPGPSGTRDVPAGQPRQVLRTGFKMPFVKLHDGESDPQEHINNYVQVMIAVDASDALMCRCFLQTVDSKVADWVNHIPARSIRTWDELGLRFLEHFAGNCRPKKHFTHLASIRQKHEESLKNFLIRWRKESREVEGTDDKSRLAMFTAALQDGLLHSDLTTHPPDTFEEAMVWAGRYITLEERKEEKKEKTPREEEKVGNKKPFKNKKQGFPDGLKGTNPRTSERHKYANPKVCNVEDTGKWCAYHRKNDHNTEDCYTLKNEMARLIRRGHLKKFVQDGDAGNSRNAQNGKRRDKKVAQAEAREKRHIGLEDEEEDSESALHRQKRHQGVTSSLEGILAETRLRAGRSGPTQQWSIRCWLRRDALVITIDIMDLLIHKTLVDTGCSGNIMYMDTYKALGLTRDELSPIKTPLTGFTSDSIEPEGATKQPIKYDTQVGEVTAQLLRAKERRPRVEVASDIEEVELESGTPGRLVRIGKGLGAELRTRPSIKGQALADFQVECTAREMTRAWAETRVEDDWWVMSINGSSGSRSCGAGIVLITAESFQIYYAIRFQFRVSNNEAEYEALINGLRILGKPEYTEFRYTATPA